MSPSAEDEARAQLRERQGAGARYDSDAAPARALLLARQGTAYFARKLNELSDAALDGPSLVPGWTRRHVVAHIGYHARRLARLAEAARKGATVESFAEPDRNEDVSLATTLPAHALRYLFDHSEVHLNVEWRDLTDAEWDATIRAEDGKLVTIRSTPWLRAQEIWLRAVDLNNGGRFADFPSDLLDRLYDRLVRDLSKASLEPGIVLVPIDRTEEFVVGSGGCRISGTTADIVLWLSGRGKGRLTRSPGGSLPVLPPLWDV